MKYIVRSVDGDEYGPFTSEELRDLVREDRLGPGDYVRRESGQTWSPFEKIAGLGDRLPDADASPKRPTRPTIGAEYSDGDAAPERTPTLEPTLESEPEPELESVPIEPEARIPPASDPVTSEPDAAGDREPRGRRVVVSDLLGDSVGTNPFVNLGLPLSLEEEEEVRFVLVQSFIDAFKDSPGNALLGHRGTLVCTDRRAVAVRPSFTSASMKIAWLDAAGTASLDSRTSMVRLLLGAFLLLQAIYLVLAIGAAGALGAATVLGSDVTGLVGGVLAILSISTGLFGLLLVATARRRTIGVASSGAELAYGCRAASPWHLSQIDEARRASRPREAPPVAGD